VLKQKQNLKKSAEAYATPEFPAHFCYKNHRFIQCKAPDKSTSILPCVILVHPGRVPPRVFSNMVTTGAAVPD
jgi:hypothetical protein